MPLIESKNLCSDLGTDLGKGTVYQKGRADRPASDSSLAASGGRTKESDANNKSKSLHRDKNGF